MRSFLIAFIAILVAMLPTRASGLLGQSLNTDALRVLGRVAFQPGLAVPHIAVPHVGHVDWSALHRAGVRAVVFDKDNTLTAPYVNKFDDRVVPAIESCRAVFGASNVVLMSNSAGGPDDIGHADAARVEAALGLAVLRRKSKKPKGFDELLRWFNRETSPGSVQEEKLAPHELCMVGDRALTDVVFGNLHGMLTVHVLPLTLQGDNKPARVLRSLENQVLVPLIRAAAAAGAARACAPPPHPALTEATNAASFVLEVPLEAPKPKPS